jgi:hypothetical protein
MNTASSILAAAMALLALAAAVSLIVKKRKARKSGDPCAGCPYASSCDHKK